MIIQKDKTVAEYVSENIKTAHIFKKHGIDFCCGGSITLTKVCENKGIDYDTLEQELSNVDMTVDRSHDYNNWDLGFLIDHIINVHHKYVEESLPILLEYSDKVAKVHGHHYSEVVEINHLVHAVAEELSLHLKKEELILFPFVKELEAAKKEGRDPSIPPFGTVNNPIRMMEHEHENAGDTFKTIAQLTNNYNPPEGACNTFRALYAMLEEFEEDLHRHIHLENNIVHRKASILEQEMIA